ncbi:hypothetical protein KI387_020109, partial [Taxus chinensis]
RVETTNGKAGGKHSHKLAIATQQNSLGADHRYADTRSSRLRNPLLLLAKSSRSE